MTKIVAMADITEVATRHTVGVPLTREDVRLIKEFPYWQAYFFRLGLGLPIEQIKESQLKQARAGDYTFVISEGKR